MTKNRMTKVKFWHVALSLCSGIALSAFLSLPALHSIHRQAMETTQEDIDKIYRELNEAMVNVDTIRLQELLADGFVLETFRGDVLTKQEWIRSIQRGIMRYNHAVVTGVKAIGRNRAQVSSILMGEVWDNQNSWQVLFHLEIIKKGQVVQVQRLTSQLVCEQKQNQSGWGATDKWCQKAMELKQH